MTQQQVALSMHETYSACATDAEKQYFTAAIVW